MSSTTGPKVFRWALLIESAGNIGSIIPLILAPRATLSYLTRNPAFDTPTAVSLVQWIGALIVVPTIPLIMAYPEPTASQPPSLVIGRRRTAYLTLGVSEVALAILMMGQYLAGDSGLDDKILLSATATFTLLVGMRGYFLYVRPEWMAPTSSSSKAR